MLLKENVFSPLLCFVLLKMFINKVAGPRVIRQSLPQGILSIVALREHKASVYIRQYHLQYFVIHREV